MKKNNKGLTLIELVVTIAIIAIFSGIVLSIISSGSSMYRSTSSNAKVQMETQQTLDTLQNLVIDANRSVYYALGSGDNLGAPLGNDIDDQSVVGSKTFLVCKARELPGGNTEQCTYDIVDWDAENQKLYYSQKEYEREKTEPDTGNTSNPDTPSQASVFSDDGEEAAFSSTAPLQKSVRTGEVKTLKDRFVMAENITDFRVDVDKVVKDRIVRFQITENVNGKEIETLHTVNLRNQIQIAEPDVAFDKAPPSKASIMILDPPKELKAGSVRVLDKYVVGDVIMSTIKWSVLPESTASGSFNPADLSYGQLTVGEKQTGTIVVQVSAQTKSGEPVSDSATIEITDDVQVAGISADNNEVLLAVGGSYDLNDSIVWHEKYTDGSLGAGVPKEKISWGYSGSDISVDKNGRISTKDSNGTLGTSKDNSVFGVSATYVEGDKTFTDTVTVRLARLDIVSPSGTYNVGDEKPFDFVYKEGGVEVDVNPVIITDLKPDAAEEYVIGNTFVENDIGEWRIVSRVALSERNGHGIVESEGVFNVQEDTDVEEVALLCKNKAFNTLTDIVYAGNSYICSYHNSDSGFTFNNVNRDSSKYMMKWEIKGNPKRGTYLDKSVISPSDGHTAILHIDSEEEGFLLSASLTIYDDRYEGNVIKEQYKGVCNVRIAKGIKVLKPSNTVINGNKYKVEGGLIVSQISNPDAGRDYSYTSEIIQNAVIKPTVTFNPDLVGSYDKETQVWTVPMAQSIPVRLTMLAPSSYFLPEVGTGEQDPGFEDSIDLNVQYPSVRLEVLDQNGKDKSTISKQECTNGTLKLKANLYLNNKEVEWDNSNMTWSCTKDGNAVNSRFEWSSSKERLFYLTSPQTGKYVVTVEYTNEQGNKYSSIYTVNVV